MRMTRTCGHICDASVLHLFTGQYCTSKVRPVNSRKATEVNKMYKGENFPFLWQWILSSLLWVASFSQQLTLIKTTSPGILVYFIDMLYVMFSGWDIWQFFCDGIVCQWRSEKGHFSSSKLFNITSNSHYMYFTNCTNNVCNSGIVTHQDWFSALQKAISTLPMAEIGEKWQKPSKGTFNTLSQYYHVAFSNKTIVPNLPTPVNNAN